ncbi:MAG: hypothetical protein J6K00_04590, partial [Oscillospiraceae bacterium]|nr:hypothetical protein [Oscillospiraceae bacterium]
MGRTRMGWKQILCIFLVFVFVSQLVPAQVLAEVVNDTQELGISAETVIATEETEPATIVGEVEELREENVKHFRLSDGSFIATQYAEPVHYQASNGDWKDIDNTLTLRTVGDDQMYTAQMGKVTKRFAGDLSDGMLFEISYEDYSVGMSIIRPDAEISPPVGESTMSASATASSQISTASVENPAAEASVIGLEPEEMSMPEKLSSGVTYSNVYSNTDIVYENSGYDIKESIIVNSPQASYSYAFGVDAENLSAELNDGGDVEFKNDEGEIVFVIPAPYMVDANGEYSDAAHYELIEKDGSLLLGLIADTEWMNAQGRAYPVSIDPSIYLHYKSTDLRVVCLRKNSPNSASASDGSIFCGKNGSSNYGVCQMGIQVETLPTVPKNCVIVNAQMMVAYVGLFSNGSSSSSSRQITVSAYKLNNVSSDFLNLTWNGVYGSGGLGRNATVLDYQKLSDSNLGGFVSWDVTPAAHEWYKSTSKKGALIFVSENEASQGFYASFVGHRWYDNSPYFIVNYRNTVGIEDYYTYQTASAARAGTVYIGDCSNQLTLVNTDVSYGTEAVSAEVSHVYNTAYANQHFDNDSTDINTQNYSSMKVGLGWKLSVQQTLKKVTIGDTEYLVYNDADGTEHYFPKTATNTYEDEDGLGLKIVRSSNDYIMTDTDAYNTWTFTNYGYLIKIADSNGNTTNINYANGRIETITVQADGGTAVTVATLTYNSDNYLSEITDYRGNITHYFYTAGGKLEYIQYAGNTADNTADDIIVNYYYTTDGYITKTHDSESGYGLRFTYWGNGYSGKTINQIAEYTASSFDSDGTNDVLGNAFHAYKPSAQLTSYRFYGQDHVSNMNDNSGDDVLVNYVFDYAGRTICSYETDSTKAEVIGSSAASYTTNSGTSGKNNRLTGAGAMGIMYPNVYIDGGFENTWNVTGSGVSRNSRSATNTTNNSIHSGMHSMCLEGSGSYGVVPVTLEAKKEYTFSFYVLNYNTTGWGSASNAASSVCPVLMSSSGTEISISDFTPFKTQTARSIEKGWEKVSWTFTTPEGSGLVAYKLGVKGENFTGKVYVDDMQIEENSVASQTNLVQNGKPSGTSCWSLNGSSYDSSTVPKSPFGTGVIKVIGSPSANRSAVQIININDEKGGTYILSGWGKASAVGSTEKEYDGTKPYFGMLAAVVYTDQSGEEWHYVPFNKDYTDWQYASGIVIPKRDAPVKLIKVYLFYTNNANTAYFDNISLVREPCSSYSYDDKGNPVSAKEGGAKTDCEYESGTSILTKYTASTGVVTNFTYESGTHNLLTTTSAGVTSANTYNDMGLVNTTTTSSSDQSLKQQSSAVYDPYGRKTSSTDVNNITTTNTYINHFLKSTQTGNMPTQEYRYNVSDGRMNQTFMSGYAIQHYLYENGQLSDLSRKGKVNDGDFWQSYHFEYDGFGNMTRIGVSSANNDTAQDVGSGSYRTLATYSYKRDQNDNTNNGLLYSMTYGNGNTVSYEYDIFDRTTKETYNNGVVYNYAYDASGALAKQWSSTGE